MNNSLSTMEQRALLAESTLLRIQCCLSLNVSLCLDEIDDAVQDYLRLTEHLKSVSLQTQNTSGFTTPTLIVSSTPFDDILPKKHILLLNVPIDDNDDVQIVFNAKLTKVSITHLRHLLSKYITGKSATLSLAVTASGITLATFIEVMFSVDSERLIVTATVASCAEDIDNRDICFIGIRNSLDITRITGIAVV